MTEIAIWQPGEVATADSMPNSQLDDWIMVADKVARLAELICRSPFVPDGLRGSVPATAAAILTGRELGIPPMTSLANIHVIHGKPGLSALVMRALVMREGHEWQDVEVNNTRVIVKGRRKGEVEWTTASFSTADAAIAKLQLGGYPQDKLYARATARLARRKFADVIAGMPYSLDELEDGVVPDEGTEPEAAATPPAAEQPKTRTAQRRQRGEAADRPTVAAPATASAEGSASAAPAPAQTARSGDLPPLPGEDEPDPTTSGASSSAAPDPSRQATGGQSPSSSDGSATTPDDTDYDTPGTVTQGPKGQLTAIWTILGTVYHFGHDEKDAARGVCEQILSSKGKKVVLKSSTDLSYNQARTVLDTLSHWHAQALHQQEEPRGYLMLMLHAAANGGEVPGDE